MTPGHLKGFLTEYRVRPSELAAMLGVTHRAVNLWMSGEREIPGPVEAYIRLLGASSAQEMAGELYRIRKTKETK
jgi:DNA-binding transcriptional regulator YiaG